MAPEPVVTGSLGDVSPVTAAGTGALLGELDAGVREAGGVVEPRLVVHSTSGRQVAS